jgi:hypothetical protein
MTANNTEHVFRAGLSNLVGIGGLCGNIFSRVDKVGDPLRAIVQETCW